MIPISNITGRLGNQMFQFAFLYSYARDHGLDYYFQDEYFFQDHKEAIRTMFGGEIPAMTDRVAIHVRRGKNPLLPSEPAYSENSFYVNLFDTDYYPKAMKLFPNKKFLVFSDDIEWCKKQDIFKDCEFFHGTEIEDMNKMASCVGHIIANSSFSWWGAWLSTYTQLVIAPSKYNWYSDHIERTVCPEDWIRI